MYKELERNIIGEKRRVKDKLGTFHERLLELRNA
jgi:hypothetical protein